MGYKRDCIIVLIILNAWLCQFVQGSESNKKRDSLDSFLYDYSLKKIRRMRSGKMYNVVPPANLSGIGIAINRIRTNSLYRDGVSHESATIPPRLLPWPYTKRVDIVYQNLGNWSSYYYTVPNHTFVAPVIGFLPYDSNTNGLIHLRTTSAGHPFVVNFSSIFVDRGEEMRCVRFDTNGTFELGNITMEKSCVVRELGHVSVVVPNEARADGKDDKKYWWIFGIVGGVVGVMVVVVVCVVGWKRRRRRMKMKRMEEEAERREELETTWIGRSRMPCAASIRTLPVLESSDLP